MSVDALIEKFGGLTETYFFYDGEVELRYDPRAHVYLLVKDGELVPQEGVTSVCHIIDKSEALVPWACKQMAGMLLTQAVLTLPDGQKQVRNMAYQEFENLVLASKKAHKETLEDAGEVGHIAHDWIERYIKAVIAHGSASIQVQETLAKFPEDERAMNACLAALDWMRAHNVRWLGTERKIFSRKYGYAGTMDGLCMVDACKDPHCCKAPFKDRLTISDWKTSNSLYPEYLLQTSAYMQAYNEELTYTTNKEYGGIAPVVDIVTDRWIIRLGKEDAQFEPWHAPVEDFVKDFRAFELALDLKQTYEEIRVRTKNRVAAVRESIRAERKALREAADEAERVRKAIDKAERKAASEEALKLKCKGADKYQGIRAPKCNGGEPCASCVSKYAEVQGSKVTSKEKKPRKSKQVVCEPLPAVPTPHLLLTAPRPTLLLSAPKTPFLGMENQIAVMGTWLK